MNCERDASAKGSGVSDHWPLVLSVGTERPQWKFQNCDREDGQVRGLGQKCYLSTLAPFPMRTDPPNQATLKTASPDKLLPGAIGSDNKRQSQQGLKDTSRTGETIA